MFSTNLPVEYIQVAELTLNHYVDRNGFFDAHSAEKEVYLKVKSYKMAKLICQEVNEARPLLPVMVETVKRKIEGDCLSGAEIVKWIMEYYDLGETKAWELAGIAVKKHETRI